MNCHLFGSRSLTIECARSPLDGGHTIEGFVSTDRFMTEWTERYTTSPVISPETEVAASLSETPYDLLLSVVHLSIIQVAVIAQPRIVRRNLFKGAEVTSARCWIGGDRAQR